MMMLSSFLVVVDALGTVQILKGVHSTVHYFILHPLFRLEQELFFENEQYCKRGKEVVPGTFYKE